MSGPTVWDVPAEPGPEVRVIRDKDDDLWWRHRHGWQQHKTALADYPGYGYTWRDLFSYAPLTDATAEFPNDRPAEVTS